MKTIILLMFLTLTLFCNKENKRNCEIPVQRTASGDVVPNAIVSQPLITQDMIKKEHIIQTNSQNKYKLQVSLDNGNTLGVIDFNQYTVLGKYTRTGGCRVTFERNVSRNDMEKAIYYKIKIYKCGTCEINWESMNWILVPKIPDDYKVNFRIVQ